VLELARRSSFRNLWLAGFLSTTGTEISRIGLFLYLFGQSGSISSLALFVALKTLPGTAVAPLAGLLVDRRSKRAAMFAADVVRALSLLAVIVRPGLTSIYVMAVVESVATAVFEPAKAAALPLILDRDAVPRANSVLQGTASVTAIVGPAVGAHLMVHGGLALTLFVDALSYVASALLVARVRTRDAAGEHGPAGRTSAAELAGGWRWLLRDEPARQLVLLMLVGTLCGGIWVPIAPFFVRDHLRASPSVLGLQVAAFGLGGALGGVLAFRLGAQMRNGALALTVMLAEAMHVVLYSQVTDLALSLVVLASWGLTVSLISVSAHSILQGRASEDVLGRLFAVVTQGESAAMLVAMCVAMLLGDRVGSQLVLLLAGLGYCGLVLAAARTCAGRALLVTR
jgi:MFS family permease